MNHIVTYLKSFFMRGKCSDEKLLDKTDLIYLSALVLVFTVLAFFRLGDAHAPESSYTADAGNRDIVLDFGDYTDIGSFSVFLGNLNTRRFSISAFNEMTGAWEIINGEAFAESVFAWNKIDLNYSLRYLGIVALDEEAILNELVFQRLDGTVILPYLTSRICSLPIKLMKTEPCLMKYTTGALPMNSSTGWSPTKPHTLI